MYALLAALMAVVSVTGHGWASLYATVTVYAPHGSVLVAYYKPLLPWFGWAECATRRVGELVLVSVPLSYTATAVRIVTAAAPPSKLVLPPSPILVFLSALVLVLGIAAVLVAAPSKTLAINAVAAALAEALLPVSAAGSWLTVWGVLDNSLPGTLRPLSAALLLLVAIPPAASAVSRKVARVLLPIPLAVVYAVPALVSPALVYEPGPALLALIPIAIGVARLK